MPLRKILLQRCQFTGKSCTLNRICRFSTKEQQQNEPGPRRVFSGIQPTGIPHLGNYVGAIRNWVQLQKDFDDVVLSVVDLHSITIPQDPSTLRENIFSMTACLLACGIDPDRCVLFQQSAVAHHTELSWILACLCTLPRLRQLPQWKEKSKTLKDPSIGLFTYPILQSADILLYKALCEYIRNMYTRCHGFRATHVPVGEDQVQHIQLARDLAKAFNRDFGHVFPMPEVLTGDIPKIRSLRKPENKMSKSEINPLGRIELTDSADEVSSKVKKAMSDFTPTISYDRENRPGIANLIDIHSSLTGLSPGQIVEESTALDTVGYKDRVAEVVNETIQPIREEITRLLGDRQYLLSVLGLGAEKASKLSANTMQDVRRLVGFR